MTRGPHITIQESTIHIRVVRPPHSTEKGRSISLGDSSIQDAKSRGIKQGIPEKKDKQRNIRILAIPPCSFSLERLTSVESGAGKRTLPSFFPTVLLYILIGRLEEKRQNCVTLGASCPGKWSLTRSQLGNSHSWYKWEFLLDSSFHQYCIPMPKRMGKEKATRSSRGKDLFLLRDVRTPFSLPLLLFLSLVLSVSAHCSSVTQ